MMRTPSKILILAAAALFCAPAQAPADILTLTSGLVVEGIVCERGDKVDVQVPEGSFTYRRDVVKSIVRKAGALQDYQTRRAAVKPTDAEGIYQLGLFCEKNALAVPASLEFARAAQVNPRHEGAHLKLGHIREGDLWYSESDYQSHQGNLRVDGMWVSRDVAAAREELRQMESATRAVAVRSYYERLARQEAAAAANSDTSACGSSISVKSAGPWIQDSLWSTGQHLHIVFADGTPEQQADVKAIAPEWTKYANLTFDFGTATADFSQDDVRISFQGSGSHSALGRQALGAARSGQVSMQLSTATHGGSPKAWRRTILHEFGHLLGLLHEHQNPRAKIRWNEQYVTQYLSKNGMSAAEARDNVLTTAGGEGKDFDPKSIMLYYLPRESNLDGVEFSWNTELSPMDQEVAAGLYPGRGGSSGPAAAAMAAAPPPDNRDLARMSNAAAALRRDVASLKSVLAASTPAPGSRAARDLDQRLQGLEDTLMQMAGAYARRVAVPVERQRAMVLTSLAANLTRLRDEVLALRRERRSRG